MTLAHRRLGVHAKLPGSRAAGLMICLCGVALLSACAGFTEHVSRPREPTDLPASALAERDAVAMPARYASPGGRYSETGPIYYDDRKASRSVRASQRSGARTTRDSLIRTGGVSVAQSQVAHAAATSTGNISDTLSAADEADASWRASRPAASLDVASIAFNVPTSMTLDRRTLIQLALATTGEARTDAMMPTAADAGQRMGPYIEATLSGGDFVIEPVTAGTQALGPTRTTEWLWLVTPKKPGKQHLQLTVTALTDTDAGSAPLRRALPTFEHTVLVSTRWQDDLRARIDANAAWLWAALLAVPMLLLMLYARWRRKHRRWFRSS